jgi:hypothetical protein
MDSRKEKAGDKRREQRGEQRGEGRADHAGSREQVRGFHRERKRKKEGQNGEIRAERGARNILLIL